MARKNGVARPCFSGAGQRAMFARNVCCTLPSGNGLFQCDHRHHQHSSTGRTIFDSSKLPLTTWFPAMHLIAQAKTGISALSGHRHSGVSYNTARSLKWPRKRLAPGSTVYSDGPTCFRAVTAVGCRHVPIVTGGGPESMKHEEFTWVDTMIGNVKNAVAGVYHAIRHKHLPRYLAEYCYRFNRRFDLETLMPRLGRAAARTPPMPYRLLKMAEVYG